MTGRQRILLVDDEPGIVQSLARTLRSDFEVYTATSGPEALRVAAEQEIAIIITDQRMPEMTGVELLAQAHRVAPLTIGIVLTGYADLHAVVDAINVGEVFRYHAKPWDLDKLREDLRVGGAALEAERRRLRDLERLNSRLEQEVAIRTAEVKAQSIRLQEMIKLRRRFLANVSHQMRSPLQVTRTNLYLLTICSAEKRQQYLDSAIQGQAQLEQIVQSVLDFVDLDLSKGELDLRTTNINVLAGEVVEIRRVLADDRQLELRWRSSPTDLHADVDVSLVRKAFDAVLVNALSYTPSGGAVDDLDQKELQDGDVAWAAIEVLDTGPGIASAEQEFLFEPLLRGQEQASGHSVGIGLGLPLAAEIMRWHGGSIRVKSSPGRGSVFTLLLPIANLTKGADNG